MKLFLFNPQDIFDKDVIAERTKSSPSSVRKEIACLLKMDLIKSKDFTKEIERRGKVVKKRVSGWHLNDKFPYLLPLQHLLIKTAALSHEEILRKLSKAGRLKFVTIAGVFLQDFDSRVDLLVAGDNLSRAKIESAIKSMEAEIGRELQYTALETADFKYRLEMYDKLVRDVLDFTHEVVLDKLGVS